MFCDVCMTTEGEIKRLPFTWLRTCQNCRYLYGATREVDVLIRYDMRWGIDTDKLGKDSDDPHDTARLAGELPAKEATI